MRVCSESLKQDNERHISGCARCGSASIVCDVVINKLNLTCAFLPPLSSFKLMIWFPFNSTHTSTDPCPSSEYAQPFVAEKVHFQLEGTEILLHKYQLCMNSEMVACSRAGCFGRRVFAVLGAFLSFWGLFA